MGSFPTGPGRAEIPLRGDMRSISGVKLKEVMLLST